MRRKSERVKDKDKSTEKKADRSPKKSRRSSRRRRKSSSTSPEESETDEYDSSFKSCKDDTEEEHSSGRSVLGKSRDTHTDIDMDAPALATETQGKESPQVSSGRIHRHSKKQSAEEAEEKQTAVQHVNENQEEKVGADVVGESLEKHKEIESKSSVWQVKSTDCSGGDIKKLKLCIVRPPEPAETEPRKRKKLSRMPHRESEVSTGEAEGHAAHDSSDEKRKRKSSSNITEDSKPENRKHHGSAGRNTKTEVSSDDEQRGFDSSEDTPASVEISVGQGEMQKESVSMRMKEGATDQTEENKEPSRSTGYNKISTDDNIVESFRPAELAKSPGSPNPFDKLKLKKADISPEHCHISPQETNVNNNAENEADAHNSGEGRKPSDASGEILVPSAPSEEIPMPMDSSVQCPKVPDSSEANAKARNTLENMPKSCDSFSEKSVDITENKSKADDSFNVKIKCQDTSDKIPTIHNSSEKILKSSGSSLKKATSHDSSDSEEEKSNYRKLHESKKKSHRLTRHTSDTRPTVRDTQEKTLDISLPLKSSTFKVEISGKSRDLHNSSKSTNKQTCSSKDSKYKEVPRDTPHLERRKHKSADNQGSAESTEKPQVREKISLKRSSSRVYDASISDQIALKGEGFNVQDGKNLDGSNNARGKAFIGSEPQPHLTRKRRWGASKSTNAIKKPTLSISSDSLKHLVPEVKPLPISEVQLTEDEDEEEEEGEVLDKAEESFEDEAELTVEKRRDEEVLNNSLTDEKDLLFSLPMVPDPPEGKTGTVRKISIVSSDAARLQRSPSPARHRVSNVLFVTNLVRPFTVNQLRELLARTGTIVDNGFWIDKIKSKCYVQYESETEARETRHALHGVRWPVSNPKQLSVDYAKKEDMDLARDLAEGSHIPRKTEPLKMDRMDGWLAEQSRDKDREQVLREDRDRERVRGKERHALGPMEVIEKSREAKMAISVREWDLGKMDMVPFDERGFHREERSGGDRERRMRKERGHRSPSREQPGRKTRKKDEEAPAKLLDDLFKKTKVTPCVYWLPLTADQIVVKEEMRRKHMAEHERRMAEMRKAEKAERDRQRARMQGRTSQRRFDDRERDKRRHRSPSGSPKK